MIYIQNGVFPVSYVKKTNLKTVNTTLLKIIPFLNFEQNII